MIKAKGNYRDTGTCRFRRKEEESTEHLGVCGEIDAEKVTVDEIKLCNQEKAQRMLSGDTEWLKRCSRHTTDIMCW